MTPQERKAMASTLVGLLRESRPSEVIDLVGPLVRSGDLDLFEDVRRESDRGGCSFLARWLDALHNTRFSQQMLPKDFELLDAWTKMPGGAWWNQPDGTARQPGVSLIENWMDGLVRANPRPGQAEVSAVMAHAPLPPMLAWQAKDQPYNSRAKGVTPGSSLLAELVKTEDSTPETVARLPLPSEVLMDRGVSPKARTREGPVAADFKTPGQWTRFLAAGGDAMESIPQPDQKPALPLWQHLYNQHRDSATATTRQLAENIKTWAEARPEVKQALMYGDAAKYFWSVRSRSGSSRQPALTSRKDWNTIVDSRGRNVLMHLLGTDSDLAGARDLFSERIAMPKAAALVQAADFSGANLWHYLFANGTEGHDKYLRAAINGLVRAGTKVSPDAAGRGLLTRALLDPVSLGMENYPFHGTRRPDLMQDKAMVFDPAIVEETAPQLAASPEPWLCASETDRRAAIRVFESDKGIQERKGLANLADFFCRHNLPIGPEWASLFLESVMHHVQYAKRGQILDYLHAEGGALTPAAIARVRESLEVDGRLAEIKPILDNERLAAMPGTAPRPPRRRV